jgi:hypothetical protein
MTGPLLFSLYLSACGEIPRFIHERSRGHRDQSRFTGQWIRESIFQASRNYWLHRLAAAATTYLTHRRCSRPTNFLTSDQVAAPTWCRFMTAPSTGSPVDHNGSAKGSLLATIPRLPSDRQYHQTAPTPLASLPPEEFEP